MKHFLFLVLLLGGLISCSKKEDANPTPPVSPPVSRPVILEGKWAQVKQVSTDGQTTNTGTWKVGEYSVAFTGTEYVWYSDSKEMYRYPYTFSNNIIQVAGPNPTNVPFTVLSLTSTGLILTFSGAPTYPTLIFTNTYIRQ